MLVAVSFAVGLVTDDVIKALIGFVDSKLGTSDEKNENLGIDFISGRRVSLPVIKFLA